MSLLYSIYVNNVRITALGSMCIGFNKCSHFKSKTCLIKSVRNPFRHVIHYHNKLTLCIQGVMTDVGSRLIQLNIKSVSKPPNIFVYTGEDKERASECFTRIKAQLLMCVNPDSYVIYHLQHSQISKLPWQENTSLLILSNTNPLETVISDVLKYFENGGKILLSHESKTPGSSILLLQFDNQKNWHTLATEVNTEAKKTFSNMLGKGEIVNGKSEIVKYFNENGAVIVSAVQLFPDPPEAIADSNDAFSNKSYTDERLHVLRDILQTHLHIDCQASSQKIPDLTPVFLLAKNDRVLNDAIKSLRLQWSNKRIRLKKTTLEFLETLTENCKPTEDNIPVIFGTKPQSKDFEPEIFFRYLRTKKLGHVVLFSEVASSTMNILDGLTLLDGAVCVALRQTQGTGRGSNCWLSPIGCAMFTVHVSLALQSNIGQRLPFVQHLMALAVVSAVRALPGYEELDLRIKWPNDIYFGERTKLGGVIVTSTLYGDTVHCYIGTGINLDNHNPTTCINDVIRLYNLETGHSLSTLRIEEMLAMVLRRMEDLLDSFQKGNSADCMNEYHKYWLHSHQELTLEATNQKVTVIGVDDCGFLLVKTHEGQDLTLQPDGNGLDMMTGMLVVRSK